MQSQLNNRAQARSFPDESRMSTLNPGNDKSMDTFRADVKVGLAATEAPAPVTPTTPKKYYRVQVGAYSVKANADAMLAKIKAAGFTDAFIKYSE